MCTCRVTLKDMTSLKLPVLGRTVRNGRRCRKERHGGFKLIFEGMNSFYPTCPAVQTAALSELQLAVLTQRIRTEAGPRVNDANV